MAHAGDQLFPLGSAWTALPTARNTLNEIMAGKRVYLQFADASSFSIYVDQGMGVQLRVPRDLWGQNFRREFAMPIASAYITSKPNDQVYR